jgi:poly-gamma-glutamate synthesis protein (capsule biosynthesis protein)
VVIEMIKLTAVGDIMMGNGVETMIKRYGVKFPFQHISSILKNSDITFGNLEAPLTNETNKAVSDYTKIIDTPLVIDGKVFRNVYCRALPSSVEGLVYAGFDIVSLANNHILDYGTTGLFDTINILSERNIKYVGAGKNINDARKPVIIQVKNMKVGFLAYSDVYLASKQKPGVASTKYIKKDIRELKDKVDIIVVSIHGGMSIADHPLPDEIRMLHSIIDSGASLILRHHPHVIQGIERYNKGVIVYSLGNFVFDYNIDPLWKDLAEARESMIFQCELSKNGIEETNIIPAYINDHYQPEFISGDAEDEIISKIEKLSLDIINKDSCVWTTKISDEYAKDTIIVGYKCLIASIKKREFKNILLMLDRIKLYHARLFIKYLAKCVLSFKSKNGGDR